MAALIRDTVFGHFVRFVTKGRYLQFIEEKDPSLWKRYLDREQTQNMALFGHAELTTNEEKERNITAGTPPEPATPPGAVSGEPTPSDDTSGSLHQEKTQEDTERRHGQMHSILTNHRLDTEKGRDATMVTWFGDDDPEVSNASGNTCLAVGRG